LRPGTRSAGPNQGFSNRLPLPRAGAGALVKVDLSERRKRSAISFVGSTDHSPFRAGELFGNYSNSKIAAAE
jgi:hypothetical protein